jgi:hypothetical protein
MKLPTLALASEFAVTGTLAFAQNSTPASPAAGTAATAPTTTHGTAVPGTGAGPRDRSDAAQPVGNADNSNSATPAPSSRISPSQKNEENGVNFPFVCRAPTFRVAHPEPEPRLDPQGGAFHCAIALRGSATGTPFKARSLSARAVGHGTNPGNLTAPARNWGRFVEQPHEKPASLSARRVQQTASS